MLLFLCNILFIPIISGTNTTKPEFFKSLVPKDNPKGETSKANITIMTEGGTVESTPSIYLPKENQTILLSLDKELGKDKSTSSGSKVVPRKGVVYPAENTTAVKDSTSAQVKDLNIVKLLNVKHKELSTRQNTTIPNIVAQSTTVLKNSITKATTETVPINVSEVHKKPLVLSNEPLDKLEENKEILPVHSSSKTTLHDKMSSPSQESGPTNIIRPTSSSRHPGMVMPVIITILVVPMFAVLGFMALRRGQEAWKNRHYKRMDFLLDGMYNE